MLDFQAGKLLILRQAPRSVSEKVLFPQFIVIERKVVPAPAGLIKKKDDSG